MTPSQKKIVKDYFDALGLKDILESEEKTRFVKAIVKHAIGSTFTSSSLFYPMAGRLSICPKDKRQLWNSIPLKFKQKCDCECHKDGSNIMHFYPCCVDGYL